MKYRALTAGTLAQQHLGTKQKMQAAHDHVHHGAAKPQCLLLQSRTSTGRVLRGIAPLASSHVSRLELALQQCWAQLGAG